MVGESSVMSSSGLAKARKLLTVPAQDIQSLQNLFVINCDVIWTLLVRSSMQFNYWFSLHELWTL